MIRSTPAQTILANAQNAVIQLKQMERITLCLIENKVDRTSDFEWMGQIRYYMNGGEIFLKMLTAKLPYGFEYTGNQKQFVATSSSDRFYRAIFVAIKHHYGFAVQVIKKILFW